MIELKNISKTYQQQNTAVPAVKNLSLTVNNGDILGIVGTSGAGKSTVLNCINLLERPDSGEVWVNGTELTALSERKLAAKRKDIGMIFQQFHLFSQRTVLQNVLYPINGRGYRKQDAVQKARELLRLVGIEEKEAVYPNQLSGGQKQRVAIARALASSPQALLCDEATSALDPETTTSILKLLADINKALGITIVLITHEKAVVKQICNRVALLEHGELLELTDTIRFFTHPQTEAAQKFIGSSVALHAEKDKILPYLQATQAKGRLYQLLFLDSSAKEAFVCEASKRFQVQIAILFGNIEFIAQQIVGNLLVTITGDPTETAGAVRFFEENHIIVNEVTLHE